MQQAAMCQLHTLLASATIGTRQAKRARELAHARAHCINRLFVRVLHGLVNVSGQLVSGERHSIVGE
jgi:hypothetical protein